MNTLKLWLRDLAIGLAFGAGFVLIAMLATPLVHADTLDSQFVNLLAEKDINANAMGIAWGHQICAQLDNGATPIAEAQKVYHQTDLSMDEYKSEWFVASAIVVYCPWHEGDDAGLHES